MRMVVSAALCQDKVIAALDGYDKDGITLKFVEKKGMDMYFDYTGLEANYNGQADVKKIVRANEWAKCLYFGVSFR